IEKSVTAQEKRDGVEVETTPYDKDSHRIQGAYNNLTDKNQGFLGLWETKEQKAKKKELEDEYKHTAEQRSAKSQQIAEKSQ
ncbi:hypothetical protein PS000_23845, partial [Shigella sonnei]|nr:hypothetical protein [Shigella sonnei]